MAVIRKNQNEQYTGGTPYSGLQGVSQNTAQQLGNYQQGYKPSDTVVEAQNRLQQVQNSKPQGYSSKYGPQLEAIASQISNPEDFKFSFDGSELFKFYADMYGRDAQKSMMNAIGNATALTGGYGNSYATQAGQQAYDERMNDLYGVGFDVYDREYQANKDKRADLYDQLTALQGLDESDYDRYRDTVADWKDELEYYTDRSDQERAFDYANWEKMLNDWTGTAEAENQDYWTNENFNESQRQFNAQLDENIRQFNESLDWDKLSTEQKYAMQNVATMLELGVAPSIETLLKAGFSQADAQAILALFAGAVASEGGGGATVSGPQISPEAANFFTSAGEKVGQGASQLIQEMLNAAKAETGNNSTGSRITITDKPYYYKDVIYGDDDKKTKKPPKTDTTGLGR